MTSLEQAQAAAEQQDWSSLNHYLQQLITSEKLPSASAELLQPGHHQNQEMVLELALQALIAGDFQTRWDVAKVFPKLGPVAIAPLIDLLEDDDLDLDVRWFVARTLGEFDCPETIKALVALLQSVEDEDLKAMAAEALAHLGLSAVEVLVPLLDQPDMQLLAVQALARIRRSEVIEPLLHVVQSPEAEVRAVVTEALGSFHDPRVTPVLLQGLQDTAAPVRQEALNGLSRRSDLLDTVDLIAQIKPCLWDIHLEVCRQAAIALGRLGSEDAVDALAQVLQSPHTPLALRIEAVRSLGWIQSQSAVNVLADALNFSEEAIGLEVVRAIGQADDPALRRQATALLIAVVKQAAPIGCWSSVRQVAALELGRIARVEEGFAPLIQLLAEQNHSVQLHAIAALKQIDATAAYSRLQQLSQQPDLPPALSEGIAIALQEWDRTD